MATGLILALAIYFFLTIGYGMTLDQITGNPNTFFTMIEGTRPAHTMGFLLTFAFMIAGTLTAASMLHGRGLPSLVGPTRFALRDGAITLGALVGLYVVVTVLPPYGEMEGLTPNLPFSTWFILLPFSLALIFIQVSAEELLFRGYLQSQLAARFASPAIWIVVPSALFGVLHYSPEDHGNVAWLVALWATAFGVFAADLTARTGTLGPAISFHLVNNVSALLFTSIAGPLSGLSLYTLEINIADTGSLVPLLMVDAAMMITSWFAVRLALRV